MNRITTDDEAAYVRREVAFGADPRAATEHAKFLRKTPDQRVRAMWNGELSLAQLSWWSANYPDQVPKINGEFAWIMMTTPEYCERQQ